MKQMFSFFIALFLCSTLSYAQLPNAKPCLSELHERTVQKSQYDLSDSKERILGLFHCSLTDNDLPAVMDYLNQHPEITSLDLTSNSIGAIGAKLIADNTTLKELVIDDNDLGLEGAQALAKNSTLGSLSIRMNGLNDLALIHLAQIKTLKTLRIGGSFETSKREPFGERGIIALANNNTLTHLSISNITATGHNSMHEALEALSRNKTLTHLGLINCNLKSDDIDYLAVMPALKSISIINNPRVGSKFAMLLAKNTNLEEVKLGFTNISDSGAKALATLPKLQTLDLTHSNISDDGVIAISNNKTISQLVLFLNTIHDKSAFALAEMTLSYLGVTNNNHMSPKGIQALKNSKTIKKLVISDEIATKTSR